MKKNVFDIDSALSLRFKAALFCVKSREDRDLHRQFARNVLNLTYHRKKPYDEAAFTQVLTEIGRSLSAKQQSLVKNICLDASSAYHEWRENQDDLSLGPVVAKETAVMRTASHGGHQDYSGLHGGSGYTGRLKVGSSAPYGAESYQSDDEPRSGLKHWVKAVTAGGAGSGYSLGEISGAKQRKEYGAVISPEEFRDMSKEKLLGVMDTATNPGNFLRAVLTYYDQYMNFLVGNIGINSGNINNPENRKTACQLDSVYRFMKEIDKEEIITPDRATRFLVLCHDLLSLVDVKYPRRSDRRSIEIFEEKRREVYIATEEIRDELERASVKSGISPYDMRRKIDSDKRRNLADVSPVTTAHVRFTVSGLR